MTHFLLVKLGKIIVYWTRQTIITSIIELIGKFHKRYDVAFRKRYKSNAIYTCLETIRTVILLIARFYEPTVRFELTRTCVQQIADNLSLSP